jgi:LmbE family N-acetylglucosaminyl deacetylase
LKRKPMAAAMTAALILLLPLTALAQPSGLRHTAPSITAMCRFDASSDVGNVLKVHDGNRQTAWKAASTTGEYLSISIPQRDGSGGIYIQWGVVPERWQLEISEDGSNWTDAYQSTTRFINEYVPLGRIPSHVRIEAAGSWTMSVSEINVFAGTSLPASVQQWQPTVQKADLMVIPAHPDDEVIYFGGTLPSYSGQQHKHTVVVYMTSSPMIRKFEALDGLWSVGVREYPVFLGLPNKYSSTLKDAAKSWGGEDKTVALLVEQIRRFKPDVIVTHDEMGEYGHGAHRLTSAAVEQAVKASPDSQKFIASAAKYGTWVVKKCYIHLLKDNETRMNWEEPLTAFDGKTAEEMAKVGYACHVSQHFHDRPVEDSGKYDNSLFGLYYSSVGPDIKGGDFFENVKKVPMAETSSTPTKSASSASATVSPAPSTVAVNAKPANAASAAPSAISPSSITVVLALAAGLIIISMSKTRKRKK